MRLSTPGTVNAVCLSITREILNRTSGMACTRLDQKINDIPNFKLSMRTP